MPVEIIPGLRKVFRSGFWEAVGASARQVAGLLVKVEKALRR